MDEYTLFDNTGLKSQAAEWAKQHIDGTWPKNLQRIHCDHPHMPQKLAECTKVIYAIGFEKRHNIHVPHYPDHALDHNVCNGIIAPGLFGYGIAYPVLVRDPMGNSEYSVGIWKFSCQIERCFPVWEAYHL